MKKKTVHEMTREDWHKYLLRKCYTLHMCCLCGLRIHNGQTYFDGGLERRAHEKCVPGEMEGAKG